MSIKETIITSEALQAQCAEVRKQLQAERIHAHRLMCAGRVYRIGGKLAVQVAR